MERPTPLREPETLMTQRQAIANGVIPHPFPSCKCHRQISGRGEAMFRPATDARRTRHRLCRHVALARVGVPAS